MNNLFYEIDYQGKIVSDFFVLPQEPKTQKIFPIDINNDIAEELKFFLIKKFLFISNGYLFYTPPGYKSAIHVDGISLHQRPALNFVLNSNRLGIMKWYKLKDGISVPLPELTSNATMYLQVEENDTEEIAQHNLKKLCLVHTGIFHNIENPDEIGRWCISIRFDQRLSFNTVLNKLISAELS